MKIEKTITIARTTLIVVLFSIISIAMCSAQSKNETLTKFSNDVALETGSVIVFYHHNDEDNSNSVYLKPNIWDASIDMHNLNLFFNEVQEIEQIVPWKFNSHDELGPNYATIIEIVNEAYIIMIIENLEMIIVGDLPKTFIYKKVSLKKTLI